MDREENPDAEIILEPLRQSFEEAVENDNITEARKIIKVVRDEGYESSAKVLERELFALEDIPHAELGDDGMIRTV